MLAGLAAGSAAGDEGWGPLQFLVGDWEAVAKPGEATGAKDGPYLSYLRALWAWDKRFPGFGHDTHGVENNKGTYFVQCLKKG